MFSLSPAEYELMLHLARFVGLALAAGGVGTILGALAVMRFLPPTYGASKKLPFIFLSCGLALTTNIANAQSAGNPFEQEVVALEAKLSQTPVVLEPVVFYGSSSFRMWQTLQKDFPDHAVLNCGFGGAFLADSIAYANRLVLTKNPAIILLYVGENDLATGTAPERAFQDFQKLFGILRDHSLSVPIAVISVKPSPARSAFIGNIRKFNDLVEDFLKTQPDTEYIAVFSSMLDENQEPIKSLFLEDKIHLNDSGYEIFRREVGKFLNARM
jgi:lysophospholipase L1-like esterase